MTDVKPKTDDEIQEWLSSHSKWKREGDELVAAFEFDDHTALFNIVSRIHPLAEQHNHHPDVHYVYNVLDLRLTTHDAGNKISQRDFDLAEAIEGIVHA